MPKKPVQVPLSAELVQLLDLSGGNVATRVEVAVVLELYQQAAISFGKGAELLGITKDEFRHMLAEREIPYFRQTIKEILHDRDVAARVKPD